MANRAYDITGGSERTARVAHSTSPSDSTAPPIDVDTTGSWFAPDPSLPLVEVPHATGPGSNDPLGLMPPALAVGYEQPLSLLDQFLAGGQSGGRSTFMLPYEPGFFRDLGIVLADDPTVVTLRPPISDVSGPSRREAALGRLLGVGLMMAATLIIPSPDDLALAAGAAGGSAARGAGAPAATFISGPGGALVKTGLSPAELLMPGGSRIGQAGANSSVRIIQGGTTEAKMMFDQLAAGGAPYAGHYGGPAVSLPGGGFVGMRTFATGTGIRGIPAATIDVSIPGLPKLKLKFVP